MQTAEWIFSNSFISDNRLFQWGNTIMPWSTKPYRRYPLLCLGASFFLICCIIMVMVGHVRGEAVFPHSSSSPVHPFGPGEQLTYECRWNAIPAGEIVLKTSDFKKIGEEPAYHFIMKIASSPFVDIFYRLRTQIDSYTDLKIGRSLLYKKKEEAGCRKRDIRVQFNWREHEIHYCHSDKEDRILPLPSPTLDPLSAFYYLRVCELKTQQIVEFPVSDGKKKIMGRAKVIGRETLKLKAGIFETFLLEPETNAFGGVFKQGSDNSVHVWISDDVRRLPLKIKSKLFIGSINIELVAVKRHP
jgi:hypothetical protein